MVRALQLSRPHFAVALIVAVSPAAAHHGTNGRPGHGRPWAAAVLTWTAIRRTGGCRGTESRPGPDPDGNRGDRHPRHRRRPGRRVPAIRRHTGCSSPGITVRRCRHGGAPRARRPGPAPGRRGRRAVPRLPRHVAADASRHSTASTPAPRSPTPSSSNGPVTASATSCRTCSRHLARACSSQSLPRLQSASASPA